MSLLRGSLLAIAFALLHSFSLFRTSGAIWCYNATLYQFWGNPDVLPKLPESANLMSNCDECSKTKAVKLIGNMTVIMNNWMCVQRSLEKGHVFPVKQFKARRPSVKARSRSRDRLSRYRYQIRQRFQRSLDDLLALTNDFSVGRPIGTIRDFYPEMHDYGFNDNVNAYEDYIQPEQPDYMQPQSDEALPKTKCVEVMQFGQISDENFAMELCSCCTNICNSLPNCGVTWLSIFENLSLRRK